jgi:hypothetical protein
MQREANDLGEMVTTEKRRQYIRHWGSQGSGSDRQRRKLGHRPSGGAGVICRFSGKPGFPIPTVPPGVQPFSAKPQWGPTQPPLLS